MSTSSSLAPREIWERTKPQLLLSLGNDILGDDAIGHIVARKAMEQLDKDQTELVETGEAGLALLEQLVGYGRAVIVDAIESRLHPPGTVMVFGVDLLPSIVAPSPHYAGLPEVLRLAERLHLPMPDPLTIVAVTAHGPFEFGYDLTEGVAGAIPRAVAEIRKLLR